MDETYVASLWKESFGACFEDLRSKFISRISLFVRLIDHFLFLLQFDFLTRFSLLSIDLKSEPTIPVSLLSGFLHRVIASQQTAIIASGTWSSRQLIAALSAAITSSQPSRMRCLAKGQNFKVYWWTPSNCQLKTSWASNNRSTRLVAPFFSKSSRNVLFS